MASSGPFYPSANAENTSNSGNTGWSSATLAYSNDGFGALGPYRINGAYLVLTGFNDFDVPNGATIDGILVEARQRSRNPADTEYIDNSVKIVKGGAIVGDDKADTVNPWPSSFAVNSYGGISDLWGVAWSPGDINASGFGIAIATDPIVNGPPSGDGHAELDYARITVYYTEAASVDPKGQMMLVGVG